MTTPVAELQTKIKSSFPQLSHELIATIQQSTFSEMSVDLAPLPNQTLDDDAFALWFKAYSESATQYLKSLGY